MLVEVKRLPSGEPPKAAQKALAVVARQRRSEPRSIVVLLLPQVLRRTRRHPIHKRATGMGEAEGPPPRAAGQMDLIDPRRLRSTAVGMRSGGRQQAVLGEAAGGGEAHALPGPTEFRDAHAPDGDTGGCTKTPRKVARKTERKAFRPGETLPGQKESRIDAQICGCTASYEPAVRALFVKSEVEGVFPEVRTYGVLRRSFVQVAILNSLVGF